MKINLALSPAQYDFILELINNYVDDQGCVDELVGETLSDFSMAYNGFNDSLINNFVKSDGEDIEDSQMFLAYVSDCSTIVDDDKVYLHTVDRSPTSEEVTACITDEAIDYSQNTARLPVVSIEFE